MKKSTKRYVVYHITSEGYESYVVRVEGRFMQNATIKTATDFTKEEALKCKKLLNKQREDLSIKWRTKAVPNRKYLRTFF